MKGVVGAPREVRKQLWVLIEKLIAGEYASKEVLQKVVGHLAFAFQFRREVYALLHHLYRYIDRMASVRWIRLPKHIQDELRSCSLHLPFAVCSMRRRLSSTILATDATPTTGGACAAEVSPELAEELWRRTEIRGEAVRLDRRQDLSLDAQLPDEPSKFASIVSECLSWRVTGSYTFRQTSHINLQETRALRRELIRLASDPRRRGTLITCLNDSRVVVGAMSKGRSSSFRLNGILRGLVPHLVIANLGVGLIWVETASNVADHPSRFVGLPAPLVPPRWLQEYGVGAKNAQAGLEVFPGSGRLTRAHVELGLDMLEGIDVLEGMDVFSSEVEELIGEKHVYWVWFGPPCSSFSGLRNLDRGGPLRPKGHPEGDERRPDVALGNRLWRRTLWLAELALKVGVFIFIEHPLRSRAWQLPETQRLMQRWSLKLHKVDWCAYHDDFRVGNPNQKATRILSNAPWLQRVIRRCPRDHEHAPPLRAERATAAGAYPTGFCRELAHALAEWKAGNPPAGCGVKR